MKTLFITGGRGFIGRHLLPRLKESGYETIYCLTRHPGTATEAAPSVRALEGDLADIDRYQPELTASDCIVHLAAATGKLPPAEYSRVNVIGTNNLLERARQCGVKRILFVSSIVVRYANTARYYYAQSKQRGEQLVRESGLDYAIVRPTIVAGEGSGVMAGFEKLTGLSRIPVFGDGRARVQPIAVEDLSALLALILERSLFGGSVFEFGGPEVLTIEEFLKKLCRARFHREPRVMHVPFALVEPPLTLLERVAYSRLPVTLGQLAVFRNDGIAESNSLFEERRAQMKTIDEMLHPRAAP